MEERNYKVYMHVNKINGKRYIGLTKKKNPNYRWSNGNGYRPNEHFWSSICKYGWDNFEHIIIANGLTKEEAEQMEIELIAKYNATDRELGYNRDNGGNTIGTHSKETRKKISESHSGEKHPMYGKHHTEEARTKMSENTKGEKHPFYGKHRSEETRKKISDTKKGTCCGSENPMYGVKGADNPVSKKVIQINKDTNELIEIYDSMTIAKEKYGFDTGNISRCCNGKRKTYKGFIWMFYDDYCNSCKEKEVMPNA